MTLKAGDVAPEFSLPDQEGRVHSLKDYAGKRVVLYFYPKDNTSGCTKEACAFRDNTPVLADKNAVALGVSADSVESHGKFARKHELPFPLLSDPDKTVIQAYGAWRERIMHDEKHMGIVRSTFLIGADGRIERVWSEVEVSGHVEEVISAIE